MHDRDYGTGRFQMRLAFGIVLLWLLLYQDAALFKVLHSFILGVLS